MVASFWINWLTLIKTMIHLKKHVSLRITRRGEITDTLLGQFLVGDGYDASFGGRLSDLWKFSAPLLTVDSTFPRTEVSTAESQPSETTIVSESTEESDTAMDEGAAVGLIVGLVVGLSAVLIAFIIAGIFLFRK
jgi:hypothetical protein